VGGGIEPPLGIVARRAPAPVAAALLLAVLAGCGAGDRPRVVSAELAGEKDEASIRILLDRKLPAGFDASSVKLRVDPPVEWTPAVERSGSRLLVVKTGGAQGLRADGIHGRDPGATGLAISLGGGPEDRVDLRFAESLPVLVAAVWEDRSPAGGNLVVDRGDWIRLVFDRAVELAESGARVRSPQDVLLSKTMDRLDDGVVHSIFEKSADPKEVRIVLGSKPVLTVSGTLGRGAGIERFRYSAPSGIALNGTPIIPLPAIRDARGGPGAISLEEIDIGYAPEFPLPRRKEAQAFPPPGNRFYHAVVPVSGGRALVIGGESAEGRQALDQVLLHDPDGGAEALKVAARLPRPARLLTATLMAGPDDLPGTPDDVVIVAGGSDGGRFLSDLTLLRALNDGTVEAQPLATGLRIPRSEHAAAALSGTRLLVDGGRGRSAGGFPGLVGAAEVLTLAFEGETCRVAEHHVFRSLARTLHTLSPLPRTEDGRTYALAYGGFGRDRRRTVDTAPMGQRMDPPYPDDIFFPPDEAAVLVSPVLIDPFRPEASLAELRSDSHLGLLRWGHAAFLIDAAGPEGLPAVLIAGGSLRHVDRDFDGGAELWEMPSVRELGNIPRGPLPQGHEASGAILFRFDPRDPARSRLVVIPHPSPDPGQTTERLSFAAVEVPGLGFVIAGGEQPAAARETQCLGGAEVYLPADERLSELAVRLTAGRARHQAYTSSRNGKVSIFLLGGITNTEDKGSFSAVEELPVGGVKQ
jgi:hypothetical protein